MKTQVVSATEFKAKCLAYLDEVAEQGASLTITKRGRPVAVLAPAKKKRWKTSAGCMAGKGRIVGDIINTSDLWEHFGETADL